MANEGNEHRITLNSVMYALFHLRDLEGVRANDYMYNIYQPFVEDFDNKLRIETIDAIEWALSQDNADQLCNLPNLPGSRELQREYLTIVRGHLITAML